MKVKELIERLNAFDPEARVVTRGRPWGCEGDWDWEDTVEVRAFGGTNTIASRYDSYHGLLKGDNAVVIDSE